MAPLKGLTLGQRQKYYNQLVSEAIAKKTSPLSKINFEDDDVDNMIRIDIACHERNVDYILEVFKCEDMLYVSRAINHSTWLITDPTYAHIINPKYLHSQLFPEMNAKAVTKLMLRIRRYLRDEIRGKAFYKYVFEKNQAAALHWLDKCSLAFIETTIATRGYEIPIKLLKRLCRKPFNVLRISRETHNGDVSHIINHLKHYLKSRNTADDFLTILESICHLHSYRCSHVVTFNKKYTNILMKICPERVKDNFETFNSIVDLSTFVKFIKTDEIKPFLMKKSTKENWKTFETLTPFLLKLPREETLNLLCTLYEVDFDCSAEHLISHGKNESDAEALFYAIEGKNYTLSNVYRWYRFAPFDVAFRDIKKFISSQFSSNERHSMLIILLTCARYDIEHVKTVLQYYHDRHINEPYLHKITFVRRLLAQHESFRFDDGMWKVLDALFHSLEVYIESGNDVQACLISIIVHNVLRDKPVHKVVENKLEIDILKEFDKEKLNSQEQEKLFNYIYNLSTMKLCEQSTRSEAGTQEAIRLLKIIWNLLKDWNKTETHYRFIIAKIAEFGEIKKESSCTHEMKKSHRKRRKKRSNRDWKVKYRSKEQYTNIFSTIYCMIKSYRKHIFESSLVLHASQEACLNALKHDPGLLTRYKSEIDSLRCNDDKSLMKFLNKLRIYWPDSLATEWTATNIDYLPNGTGHRALIRGILTLLPRGKLIDYIKRYTPIEDKIHWSEVSNPIELSIQKHIAKHMHIARPQLPAHVVLRYAKGDYLQYALLSLNTTYYNLRSTDIRKYIHVMLNAPVSLQKHGIRLAFVKFKTNEILNTIPTILKNTSNSSIRVIIFTSMFDLLCKEKNNTSIKAIWAILSSIIDDGNHERNRIIHYTLKYFCNVPVIVVGDCFQKAFFTIKTLPPIGDNDHTFDSLISYAAQFIEFLDSDFVENDLLCSIHTLITHYNGYPDFVYLKILTGYILCSKDIKIQMKKYNRLLHPVILRCVSKLADGKYGNENLLNGLHELLQSFCLDILHYVFVKLNTMPTNILSKIHGTFITLCIEEYYVFIRRWQLTVTYLEALEDMIKASAEQCMTWDDVRTKSTSSLASVCANLLAADEMRFFSTNYLLLNEPIDCLFNYFNFGTIDKLNVLYKMLSWKYTSVYLFVLEMTPNYVNDTLEIMKSAIKRKIYLYESEEVRMHYFKKFNDTFSKNNDDVSDTDEDDYTEGSQELSTTDSEQESRDSEIIAKHAPAQGATLKNDPILFGNMCTVM